MSSPHDLRLSDTGWPLTLKYEVMTPEGITVQTVTLDVPSLANDPNSWGYYWFEWWAAAMAPAMGGSAVLFGGSVWAWKAEGYGTLPDRDPPVGKRSGAVAPRERTAVMVMLTSDADGYGSRKLFMPCVPLSWTTPEFLTKSGAEELQTLARGLMVGHGDPIGGPEARWLIAYPQMWQGDEQGQQPVGFRHVRHLRVCQHVERPPTFGGLVP